MEEPAPVKTSRSRDQGAIGTPRGARGALAGTPAQFCKDEGEETLYNGALLSKQRV